MNPATVNSPERRNKVITSAKQPVYVVSVFDFMSPEALGGVARFHDYSPALAFASGRRCQAPSVAPPECSRPASCQCIPSPPPVPFWPAYGQPIHGKDAEGRNVEKELSCWICSGCSSCHGAWKIQRIVQISQSSICEAFSLDCIVPEDNQAVATPFGRIPRGCFARGACCLRRNCAIPLFPTVFFSINHGSVQFSTEMVANSVRFEKFTSEALLQMPWGVHVNFAKTPRERQT